MKTSFFPIAVLFICLFSVPTFAGQGPGSGGGGMIYVPASSDVAYDLKNHLLPEAPRLLQAVFHALENRHLRAGLREGTDGPHDKLYRPEFPMQIFRAGDKNIFSISNLPITSYVVQQEPCVDPSDLSLKDGSATGIGLAGKICLSAGNLKAKKLGEDWMRKTIALVAHEMGHLAGLSEFDCVRVQGDVEEYLTYYTYEQWRTLRAETVSDVVKLLTPLDQALDLSRSAHTDLQRVALCLRISELDKMRRQFADEYEGTLKSAAIGIEATFSPTQWLMFHYTRNKIVQLNAACAPYVLLEPEKSDLQKLHHDIGAGFMGKSISTLADYDSRAEDYYPPAVPIFQQLMIRKVQGVESKDFVTELEETRALLRKMVSGESELMRHECFDRETKSKACEEWMNRNIDPNVKKYKN